MADERTLPHDYRLLLESFPDLTIIGGQAVNVWAITYLDASSLSQAVMGSHDLDVFAHRKVDEIIAALPGWKSERPPLWSLDQRVLRLSSRANDGRPLIVEVLGKVRGLDRDDLDATAMIEKDGAKYRVLDPVAILKSKAVNVRELDQVGPPPRQDRQHLRIIAQCVGPFLRDAHAQAIEDPTLHTQYAKVVSRAFRTLSDKRTLSTLLNEGVDPLDLLPDELKKSEIDKVHVAFEHQLPRLQQLITEIRGADRD